MKMSLRFTPVHSWFSLHRPFALRSTTRKPIWFLTRQEWPRLQTLSWSIRGVCRGVPAARGGFSDNATGLSTLTTALEPSRALSSPFRKPIQITRTHH